MNLDLSSLRSLIAAAEHGSFRQAATALNIKQSALSRRIRQLEEQLDVSLFERSSGGVRLTPAGASMAQTARRLFDEIDHMVKASQLAGRGEKGVLKAGFATAVSASKVLTILADHVKSFPEVGMQVTERSPPQLITALGTGDVDIAIIGGEARQHSGPSMSLWSERIVAALSSRHPLSNSEVIDWSDLKDETFLLSQWDPGSDLRNLILKKLAAPGATPRIETWDASNEKVLGMMEAGLHVSVHFESWTSLAYTGVRFREIRDAQAPATSPSPPAGRSTTATPLSPGSWRRSGKHTIQRRSPSVRLLRRAFSGPARSGKGSIRSHEPSQHRSYEFRRIDCLLRLTSERVCVDNEIPMDCRRQVDRQLHRLLVENGAELELGHQDSPNHGMAKGRDRASR